jgi:hypothetical protein
LDLATQSPTADEELALEASINKRAANALSRCLHRTLGTVTE